jgi:hypothetical protein
MLVTAVQDVPTSDLVEDTKRSCPDVSQGFPQSFHILSNSLFSVDLDL